MLYLNMYFTSSETHLMYVVLDIDECLQGFSQTCDQTCENTIGGYRCACVKGFALDLTNRRSCTGNQMCNICRKTRMVSNTNHVYPYKKYMVRYFSLSLFIP